VRAACLRLCTAALSAADLLMEPDELSAHPGHCRMFRRRSAHHPQTGRCRSQGYCWKTRPV